MEQGIFQDIAGTKVTHSNLDLSHQVLQTLNQGWLVPNLVMDVVPDDSVNINTEMLVRLSPMIGPTMERINVKQYYFFVPNRLVWPEWEDFITGGDDGYAQPTMPTKSPNNIDMCKPGTLWDYMGLPAHPVAQPVQSGWNPVQVLPFAAYHLIWSEYFRDENLQEAVDIGEIITDNAALFSLRKKAWEKDYFTSALPWAQKGPVVTLPIKWNPEYHEYSIAVNEDGTAPQAQDYITILSQTGELINNNDNANRIRIENLQVDQEQLTLTVNDQRTANRLQEWLEKQARGGSRYIETILSHFGVRSSDSRLQRPEYLGGGSQPVVMTEVLQSVGNSQDPDVAAPLGAMGGHGISMGSDMSCSRTFEEHGWLIGLQCILPRTTYFQGTDRKFTRMDKHEYYWPSFANLGEQEVKNKEIFHALQPGSDAVNEATFGYQQRYAEYKYMQSRIAGDFQVDNQYLEWHEARVFASTPTLGSDFISCETDDRIFAVQDHDVHKFQAQIYHDIQARRPMPYFSVPEL